MRYVEREYKVEENDYCKSAQIANGCKGNDLRNFNAVVYKEHGTCVLSITDIKENLLRKAVFHVKIKNLRTIVDETGKRIPFEHIEFTTEPDAENIDLGMAFAFKPILLKLGLQIKEGTIFSRVRTKY